METDIRPTDTENVEGFHRKDCRTLHIHSQTQLDRAIDEARANNWKIYPTACGKNWGYGSHLPIENDSVVLDLSGLNRIVDIDEEHGVATIEPGVTQEQLARELKQRGSKYLVDVTGSGAQTSVLGNALDRGIAYGGLRVHRVVDFEVLTMDGSRMKTGFGDFAKPDLYGLYPHGLGPDITSLFFQSNLAIVTEAKIHLQRKQEEGWGVSVFVQDSKLPELISVTKELMELGVLEGIPHIGSRERVSSTLLPLIEKKLGRSLTESELSELNHKILADWGVTFFVSGKRTIARSRVREIRKAMSGLGKAFVSSYQQSARSYFTKKILQKLVLNSFQREVLFASRALSQFHFGVPSNAGVEHLLSQGEVKKSTKGFLLCTPLAPLSGDSASKLMRVLQTHKESFPDIETAVTLNAISSRVLEAVISLHFDKMTQSERARQLLDQLMKDYWSQGLYPYRLNIEQMQKFGRPDGPHSQFLSKVKALLDSQSLLAPGRYQK